MTTVAIIGPDGAGKSSVIPLVQARLGRPVERIYMGVNFTSSTFMLPTTRLALEAKRRRGVGRDVVGVTGPADGRPRAATATGAAESPRMRHGLKHEIRSGLRLANWIAEEWFRQGVAWILQRRGAVVLFDRHFFCDHYADDIVGRRPRRDWTRRLHGAMLQRLYPRPDLVILLDAPAEVLLARKGEGTLESLERKRQEYHALASVVARFRAVDAARPLDTVVADVIDEINALLGEQARRPRPSGPDAAHASSGSVSTIESDAA